MDTPFPFEPLLVFGIMAVMLLLGMLLNKLPLGNYR